jgi:myo-inositol-1(or 4)-monophosphatase
MAPDALTDYLDAAVQAARQGAAVLERWRGRFRVSEKGRADLVTEADLASQEAVRSSLQQRFPASAFLEEEGGGDKVRPAADAPPTWVVDPLDGTTNYVHDLPFYAVSIGLWLCGDMVVGVVYDPRQEELFTAAKGHGAWLNGSERLRTSAAARLEDALLATGFAPDLRGQEKTLAWWNHFSFKAQSLRRTGSTALNLAYVAAGRVDGYWAFDNHAWDVAGAMALIREAGGVVTNVDGSPFDPFTPDGLASNGPLHPLLLDEFRRGL